MAAPSVATTLTTTVPTIVPATLNREAMMAADTEARALAMTWIGLTVNRFSPCEGGGGGRLGSGGGWLMGSRVGNRNLSGYWSACRSRARPALRCATATDVAGLPGGRSSRSAF